MKSTTSNLLLGLASFVFCMLLVTGLVKLMVYLSSEEEVVGHQDKNELEDIKTITQGELEELLKSAQSKHQETKKESTEVKNNLEQTLSTAIGFDNSSSTPTRNFSLNSPNKLSQKTNPNEPRWIKMIFAIGVLFVLAIFFFLLKQHKQGHTRLGKTSLNESDVIFIQENIEQGKVEASIKLVLHNAENLSTQLENSLFKLYSEHRSAQNKFEEGLLSEHKYIQSNKSIEKNLQKIIYDLSK